MSTQAVLLVNLGSPDSPSVADVRRYLHEFLMDGRVIDKPWPLRFALVHFAIVPKRVHASAEAYDSIWCNGESPLIAISRRVQEALQVRCGLPVELAMRYQNPSIDAAIRALAKRGVREVLLIPLFPHYAMSSYETAVERVKSAIAALAPALHLKVAPLYYDAPGYINALAESAAPYLREPHDHLLFSFHGLPERHLAKADPTGAHCLKVANCCETPSPAHATCYRAQCFATMRAFVARAGVPDGAFSMAFQSRLGKEPWMRPYADAEIVRLAGAGVKRLLVLCPAFVSDCLETIEEIGMRGAELFTQAGGEKLTLIPCLNDHPAWIRFLEETISTFRRGGIPATNHNYHSV